MGSWSHSHLIFCGQAQSPSGSRVSIRAQSYARRCFSNDETFFTADGITLLQNLRDLCWKSPTVDSPRIHTLSFPTTDTSSTTEFSRSYGPCCGAACITAWICCRGLSCIPKYRIWCLQNRRGLLRHCASFLG